MISCFLKERLSTLLPPIGLITLFPGMFDVPQRLLNTLNNILVPGVLAHVITELDCWVAVGAGDFNDDVKRFGLLTIGFVGEVIGKVCPDTESRLETGFLGNHLVLQTVLDIEGVREDNDFLVCDALRVIEIAHHLHELRGITRVLADAGVNLCVCFFFRVWGLRCG